MTSPVLPQDYPYKPHPVKVMLGMLFFLLCCAFFAHMGLTNQDRLTIDGIPLTVNGTTIFYWVLAALSAAFVLVGFMALMTAMRNETVLRVDDKTIEIPALMFRKGGTLRYEDIRQMTWTRNRNLDLLTLHTDGEKFYVSATMLPKGAFAEVYEVLKERVK